MFSKSKINDPIETDQDGSKPAATAASASATTTASATAPVNQSKTAAVASSTSRKTTSTGATGPSVISPDLVINGNLLTEGDIQIEGTVEGDIRAQMLTVGEAAVIRGEIVAEDVVVNGRVIGRIRGNKVRLATTARVEGDILHKTIAIEAGANFEGSVKRFRRSAQFLPIQAAASLRLEGQNWHQGLNLFAQSLKTPDKKRRGAFPYLTFRLHTLWCDAILSR